MKRLKENKALQNELISCVSLLGFGAVYFAFDTGFPWQGIIRGVALLALAAHSALTFWKLHRDKHMTPEEKRELEREINDERNKMLQNMATRYCWWLEEVLLLIAFVVFVFRGQSAIYSVLYMTFAVRMLATTVIRWWLERKY